MPLLIWDFDGTLADSFGAIRTATDEAMAANGLPPVDESALRNVIGLSLTAALERLVAEGTKQDVPPELLGRVVDGYRQAFVEDASEQITMFPGIGELLADLAARAVPSAIATSKGRRGITRALDHLGLVGMFAVVVTDDDVIDKKPHPEMVLNACRGQGIDPHDAVVIGDTAFDVEMGRRAGAQTIGVTWGNHSGSTLADAQPDHLVDTVDELRRVIDGYVAG